MRFAVAGVLALHIAGVAAAASYYVSVDGRDHGHRGTADEPFLSIRRGVLAATQPGDEVIIGPGVYVPHDVITLAHGGTAEHPIVVRGDGTGRAIVDGTAIYADPAVFRVAAAYVVLEGLEIQNKTDIGVKLDGRGTRIHHVVLRELKVSNCGYAAIMIWSDDIDDPLHDIRVEACEIFNCSLVNGVGRLTSWSACMAMRVRDVRFEGNVVYENHGEGITLSGCERSWLIGNSLRDNPKANVLVENSAGVVIAGNSIGATGRNRRGLGERPTIGIELANNRDLELPPSRDLQIRGNWLVGDSCGIRFSRHRGPGGLTGVDIHRNVFDPSGGPAVWFAGRRPFGKPLS